MSVWRHGTATAPPPPQLLASKLSKAFNHAAAAAVVELWAGTTVPSSCMVTVKVEGQVEGAGREDKYEALLEQAFSEGEP